MVGAKKKAKITARPPQKPRTNVVAAGRLGPRGRLVLAGILLWGLICQILILTEAWHCNPFAVAPVVDADEYWNWAEQIANGRLVGTTPFMSAPLYPYLLGLLRALGGGLLAVYSVQVVLHLATVALLACGAAKRFGTAASLLSAALYILLTEPAYFAGRVLNCTVQLFLIVALWVSLLRTQDRPFAGHWIITGLLTGLNCLSNPPMLLAIPLLAAWAWWQAAQRWHGLADAALLVATAFTVISPATIHNYRACGEFIPISAQAGLTFAQGNAPGAAGTYTPIAGISTTRERQNDDALRLYRQTTGQSGGWNAVNRFFFRKGLDYWSANPGATLTLLSRKLYYFIAGRNVSDIYSPWLEIEQGFSRWFRLAPLPLPWLTLLGLLAIGALARHPRRYGPELILASVPLLVVVLFMFTPRYRLPITPISVVACAWALTQALRRSTPRTSSAAISLALILGIGLGFVNQAIGFDQPAPGYRAIFYHGLGNALLRAERPAEAAMQFQKALTFKPDYVGPARNLATLLKQLGRADESVPYLQTVVRAEPDDTIAQGELGLALLTHDRVDEALPHLQAVVQLNPTSVEWHNNLANALLLKDDLDGAARHWQAALQLDPAFAIGHFNLGIVALQRGDADAALEHFRTALRHDPNLAPAHQRIATILQSRGDIAGAVTALRAAQRLAPDDPDIAARLAQLSTTTAPASQP